LGSPKTRHTRAAKKAAIAGVECFDPFRRCFLYLFDELSLRDGSRQRRDNVSVISNTPTRTNSAPTSRQIVAR